MKDLLKQVDDPRKKTDGPPKKTENPPIGEPKKDPPQTELKKEMEYLQPLWVKELVDSQLLVSRREILLRRLEELGARGYMTQSEFLKKLE